MDALDPEGCPTVPHSEPRALLARSHGGHTSLSCTILRHGISSLYHTLLEWQISFSFPLSPLQALEIPKPCIFLFFPTISCQHLYFSATTHCVGFPEARYRQSCKQFFWGTIINIRMLPDTTLQNCPTSSIPGVSSIYRIRCILSY